MNARYSFFALLCMVFSFVFARPAGAADLALESPMLFRIGPHTGFGLAWNQFSMDTSRIYNYSTSTSSPISLELWARVPGTTEGHLMGTYSDGSVVASGYFAASTNLKAPFIQPPNGTYNVRIVLLEAGVYRDHYDFAYFDGTLHTITFGNIFFDDADLAGWQQSGSSVNLTIPDVYNGSKGGRSGQLRVQLFATAQPYSGSGNLNPSPGPLMAAYGAYAANLNAGYHFPALTLSVPFTQPPAGTYYSTMLLTEFDGTNWWLMDYINFPQQVTFGSTTTVATPTISPNGGTSTGSVQVTLACATAGASIHYTDNGSPPTTASSTYNGPFTVTSTKTITARAYKSGLTESVASSAVFTVNPAATVATPVISPNGSTFTGSGQVTLTCTTTGASIRYTDDGSVPSQSSTLYSAPITLTASKTIKARAYKNGLTESAIASAGFTVTPAATVATPTLSPDGGGWTCSVRVTMNCSTPGATIYYTKDGTTIPNEGLNSTRYSGPFMLSEGRTFKVRAFKAGSTPSATATVRFTVITCPNTPVLADCAWDVQEMTFLPPGSTLNTLAEAEAFAANAASGQRVIYRHQSAVINRHDPDSPGGGGFFDGDLPFAVNNLTINGKDGLNGGDDNHFLLLARCDIVITEEDDYTLGFSSDDGARLKIEWANFISSTRLNPNNPANPAHNGNMLSYPEGTGNSDTLGVCHLVPGTYQLEFLTWEGAGGANCEVFAARGAKTALDGSFRLIGHAPAGMAGDSSRIAAPGWEVAPAKSANSLPGAIARVYEGWATGGVTVEGLRFTSANDFAERDPTTFVLEGSHGRGLAGPWTMVANGDTSVPVARGAQSPLIRFNNDRAFTSYRLTFPALRNLFSANSMQIAEVAFLDGADRPLTSPGDVIFPTTSNSPVGEEAFAAIDNSATTKYLNFNRKNAGFVVSPGTRAVPVINFADPQSGGGGHGFPQTSFPQDSGADDNNFAIGARATLVITTPGDYTFCLHGDDGSRFRIKGSRGWSVSSPDPSNPGMPLPDGMQVQYCCSDVFGTVNLAAGSYEVELIYNEIAGGAYIGVWSAYGRHRTFNPLHFKLAGSNTGISTPDVVPFSLRLPSAAQPPVNDNFGSALPIPNSGGQVAGCNIGAILEPEEEVLGLLTRKTIWWTWRALASGPVNVDTLGSDNFQTMLSIWAGGSVNNLTPLAGGGEILGENCSKATFMATVGTVYRIQVGGWDGEAGRVRLNLFPRPPAPFNDHFSTPAYLGSGATLAASGNTAGATAQSGERDHDSGFGNANSSTWYSWSAPYSGKFNFDTAGSRFDTVLSIYTGSSLSTLVRVAGNNDYAPPSGKWSLATLNATGGTMYRIAVDGRNSNETGEYFLNIVPVPAVTSYGLTTAGPQRTFHLRWRSEPNTSYRVEQSSNLTSWNPVTACFASTGAESDIDIIGIPLATQEIFFRVLRD